MICVLLLQDAWRPQIEYWQKKLKDAPEMLELPGSAGRPRTSIGRCYKAPLGFNDAEYEAIKSVASSCNATPLMLITCALQVDMSSSFTSGFALKWTFVANGKSAEFRLPAAGTQAAPTVVLRSTS